MPSFTFNSPDGKKYTVNGPEGATAEQAFSVLKQQLGAQPPAAKTGHTLADTADAFVRGAANAIPFMDRITAALGAATGIGGKFGDYEGNLEAQRAQDKANLEEHPVASIGGAVVGGLMLPVGAGAQAAKLGGRIAAGVGTGGALGAAYGISASPDLRDTPAVAANFGRGMATGAVLGGLAPPVVEGLSLAGQWGLRKSGIAGAVENFRDPDSAAYKMVVDRISADRAQKAEGLTQAEFDDALARGQPVKVGDLGGDATRRLARQASNMSAEAGNALKGTTYHRFQSQGPRIADLVQNLGGGNSVETLDKLKAAAARARKPLYDKAYEEGSVGIWTPELERLSGSPDFLQAMKSAAQTGKSRAITEGFGAFNPGVQITDDGRVLFKPGAKGVPTYPDLQYWDYVKRELDDASRAAFRAGRNEEGSRIGAQAKMLRNELDAKVPSYAEARGVAASAFGAQDALEAGKAFVSAKGKNQEYAKTIAKMTPPERKLFAHGFLSELENRIGEIGDNRDVTINAMFNSSKSRQRIEMAIGKDKAVELERFLRAESIMMRLKNAVSGNSTTAEQAADLATGLTGGIARGVNARSVIEGLRAVAEHGTAAADVRVMRRVGELLASNKVPYHLQAVDIIKKSPAIQAYLKPFAAPLAAGAIAIDAQQRRADQRPAGTAQ